MNELDQATDEIRMLQERLAESQADNDRHVRQRGIDSKCIDELEERLKLPRTEITEGDTITKLTTEQHTALIVAATSALKMHTKVLENDLDVANTTNKNLHAQIEELTPMDDGEEPAFAELQTTATLAEAAQIALESQLADAEKTVKRLRHRVKELEHDNEDLAVFDASTQGGA